MPRFSFLSISAAILLLGAGCAPQSAQVQTPTPPAGAVSAEPQNTASPDPATQPAPAPQEPMVKTPAPIVSPKEKTETPPAAQAPVTVKIISEKFSPSTITVKSGTKVIFQNTDTEVHWPASAPHPTHTDLPGFDAIGGIKPNFTYERTFTEKGTWRYHDHLNLKMYGSITVE